MSLIAGAALAILLAGCAENAQDPDVATANGSGRSASAPAAGSGDQAKFEACLLDNGVDITKLEGVDAATVTAASEKCKEFAPGGGELPRISTTEAAQIRAFAQCMRSNGFPDFPDPGADGAIPADYAASPAEQEKMMPTYTKCMTEMTG